AWGPGEGIVNYPDGMGVRMRASDKLVLQVHYSLADPASVDKAVTTKIRLRFRSAVSRELFVILHDPFLASLESPDGPSSLQPGQTNATYTWTGTGASLGLADAPPAEIVAVMPHMHIR